jgi:hypothetical protein
VPLVPGWDIAFTRICQEVLQSVEACVQELSRRFQASGLDCDAQARHTARGLSTFLAVVGRRGLLFIVDITLIDGMMVAGIAGAALDICLLDACGDAVSQCSRPPFAAPAFHATASQVVAAADLVRAATSVFVMAMGHFDLVTTDERGIGA